MGDTGLNRTERAHVQTVTEVDPSTFSPLLREGNEGLMVVFINADLLNRAGLDVRDSIVFYDDAHVFAYAVSELPDEETLQALAQSTVIRYWSRGC